MLHVVVQRKTVLVSQPVGISGYYAHVVSRPDSGCYVWVSVRYQIVRHRIYRHSEALSTKTISTLHEYPSDIRTLRKRFLRMLQVLPLLVQCTKPERNARRCFEGGQARVSSEINFHRLREEIDG